MMDRSTANHLAEMLRTDRAQDCVAAADALLRTDPENLLARAYRGIALGTVEGGQASVSELSIVAEAASSVGESAVEAFARHYLGLGQCRLGNQLAGYGELERAAELGSLNPELLTALCQTAAELDLTDAAKKWGGLALQAKDGEVNCPLEDRVRPARPKPFDPDAYARNIVAYSLFGDDSYYHESAITTARQLRYVYPEFTARFYCSSSIPQPVLAALAATGSQVQISSDGRQPFYSRLMWRFLAFDDPEVDLVLVRDVDSPLIPRERAAVDAWLRSDAPFNVLRDNVRHTAPILAGLWGGFTGLLPELGPRIQKYVQRDTSRHCDQNFLREFVWPRIRDATLAVDSTYNLRNSINFPAEPPHNGRFHVGCNWARARMVGAAGK